MLNTIRALLANYLRWVPDVVLIETDKQSVRLSLRQNHTAVKNARIKQNWMSLMWNCLLSRNFIEYRLKHNLARRLEPKWRLKSMNETIDLFTVLAHNSCNPLITILSLRRIFSLRRIYCIHGFQNKYNVKASYTYM